MINQFDMELELRRMVKDLEQILIPETEKQVYELMTDGDYYTGLSMIHLPIFIVILPIMGFFYTIIVSPLIWIIKWYYGWDFNNDDDETNLVNWR